ncbi:dienelactone hydrolase family protein [Marinomonas transparens]|uniref:Dienelactone hydrolase family protein n=1 Tax=Marinomonas transparens TaxID=2795388 RepID=A0A934MWY1_9GAMM|nr:dienelactone hydrolase family protein [Marinomonas transparens]MBJ7538689.1 dienelactone hydrolase family protein [Marinomonas transparens]
MSIQPLHTRSNDTIPQEAFDWYDEYAHGDIDRRTFLARLAAIGLTSAAVAGGLIPNYALAEQVSFNDADIVASYAEFDSPDGLGSGRGYLVLPKNRPAKTAAVLVVHENRGLNPYIKDVARRLAKEGYIAFAPDILHTLGGYPGNDDEGRAMQKSLDKAKVETDFINAASFLKNHELTTDKLGVVGFCFGGYVSNMLAARVPEMIDAAVPYYGTPAKPEYIKQIKAPMLLQYAELDKRVNASWPDYEKALKAINADYTAYVYPKTNHGFHNDSTSRYDEKAAELSWKRTLEFFNKHLA